MKGLALLLVLAPEVAAACTCEATSPEEDLERSKVVAEVVILAVEKPVAEDDFPMEDADERYFAQAEVRHIWKGRSRIAWEQGRARLAFVGGGYSWGCGYGPVRPGEVHILFLGGAADAPWLSTGGCGASVRGRGPHGEEKLQRVRSALGAGWRPTPAGWVDGPGCASCATTEPTGGDAFWLGLLLGLRRLGRRGRPSARARRWPRIPCRSTGWRSPSYPSVSGRSTPFSTT